jgi:uncharacterized membrane protein YphA (DoxX/SURF4 family)
MGTLNKKDFFDLVFRVLFSSIFIGLGGEHIFSDLLIQNLMPGWVPYPRLSSILCGLILITGGTLIILGIYIRFAVILLGAFIIVVTLSVHFPCLFYTPENIAQENAWMWTVLQRSNFVKNLCLLGVCLNLWYHQPQKLSLYYRLNKKKEL